MRDIQEIIKAKQRDLKKLQTEIEVLTHAASIIGNDDVIYQPDEGIRLHFNQPQMAEAILRQNKFPMKVGEIVSRMKKDYERDINPDSLSTLLYKYSKKGNRFFKGKVPGTYGLIEWGTE